MGFNPVDERMWTLRIRRKFFSYALMNIHAPTEVKLNDDKDLLYDKLAHVYNEAQKRDIKIILGPRSD